MSQSEGFILLEGLWMLGIASVLLGSLFLLLVQAYQMQATIDQYVELTMNHRLLRQLFYQELKFAQGTVDVSASRFRINDGRPFTISYSANQLYRQLRDGQNQPLSGNMVEGAGGNYRIVLTKGRTAIFDREPSGLVHFSWRGNRTDGKLMYDTDIEVLPNSHYFHRWSEP